MTVRLDTNALTPLLQFDDVAFGISGIDNTKNADAGYFCRSNPPDGTATSRNYRLHCLVHVVNRKCNVSQPALIRDWHAVFNEFVIAENLEGRAIFTIARQAQKNAGKMRIRDSVHVVEPSAGHITLGTLGLASEYVRIEANQSFPISGNKICMNVFRSDWHCLVLW